MQGVKMCFHALGIKVTAWPLVTLGRWGLVLMRKNKAVEEEAIDGQD